MIELLNLIGDLRSVGLIPSRADREGVHVQGQSSASSLSLRYPGQRDSSTALTVLLRVG